MTIKMRKSLLIGGGAVAAIAIVITAIVLSGVVEQEEDLVLSNYPKLFEKDVIIVIGENASQLEKESAEAITSNLENLTGNKPEISNTKKIGSFKSSYNLIVVGTPNSNKVSGEIYNMTNAIRVTDEYPGAGKGILEILSNPWNEDVTFSGYASALETSHPSNSNIANVLWRLAKYSGIFALFGLVLSILSIIGGILNRKRKKTLLMCGILFFIGIIFLTLSILFYQPGPI